ncbi:cell wall phosphotransferase [Thalassotalea insulae]|uniref:Cell wall phosphotransferase n=1 Tax=Thalassotalea insulae TaxID=2056778 RepID=A0ABQ6GT60_9GAMM|nr:phosphotransferase [Thalassotalea insulae]GLX79136.1 cell wall phosphotransferase [Thalassotalea insulae]
MVDKRKQQLSQWLADTFSITSIELDDMSGDAGFRRYFRFINDNQSFIAVDAPGDKCNNAAFIDIAQRLQAVDINVPEVIAFEPRQGFICLTDLGDCLLADVLTEKSMMSYYQQAMQLLPEMAQVTSEQLPLYDQAFIQRELDIFPQWLINQHLSITLSAAQQQKLQFCFDELIDNALAQPQVFMHRDFHSRNIMLVGEQLALIDFQDAVQGPVTYDIVSLLRDCYVKWPAEQVDKLLRQYIELMEQRALVPSYSYSQWQRWFDLMGLQRHIKAAGIFARLYHRDGKPGYLADIPLTLSYIVDIAAKYPTLNFLRELVQQQLVPSLAIKN